MKNSVQAVLYGTFVSIMIAWSVASVSGCPTSNQAPPASSTSAPGAAPGTDVNAAACANLAKLQCPEGLDAHCVAVLGRAATDNITNLNAACLAAATTVQAARACGTVSCTIP